MWSPRTVPYWLEYGEEAGYNWLQSDEGDLISKCRRHCASEFNNKWFVMTYFDGVDLAEAEDYIPLEFAFIEEQLELPCSGNGEEFFFFDEKPTNSLLSEFANLSKLLSGKITLLDKEILKGFFSRLLKAGVTSYLSDFSPATVAIRNPVMMSSFLKTDVVKNLPTVHLRQNSNELKRLLSLELSDEICAISPCRERRLKYASNCPRHQFKMLHGISFPDELLRDD